jgi:hypothetical protein
VLFKIVQNNRGFYKSSICSTVKVVSLDIYLAMHKFCIYIFLFFLLVSPSQRGLKRDLTQHGISHIRQVLEGQRIAKLGTKESTWGERLKVRICIQDCFDMKEKKLYLLDTKREFTMGSKKYWTIRFFGTRKPPTKNGIARWKRQNCSHQKNYFLLASRGLC